MNGNSIVIICELKMARNNLNSCSAKNKYEGMDFALDKEIFTIHGRTYILQRVTKLTFPETSSFYI